MRKFKSYLPLTLFTPKLGLPASNGIRRIRNIEQKPEAPPSGFNPPEDLGNSGNTSEDLAALDRMITYLLGQSRNVSSGHLDSWHRSHWTSARGDYKQLRSARTTVEGGVVGSNIDTTSL